MGIDEQTALAVDASSQTTLFSRTPQGRAYLTAIMADTRVNLEPGSALTFGPVQLIGIDRNSTLRLRPLHVDRPAVLTTVEVIGGKLVQGTGGKGEESE